MMSQPLAARHPPHRRTARTAGGEAPWQCQLLAGREPLAMMSQLLAGREEGAAGHGSEAPAATNEFDEMGLGELGWGW